MRPAPDVTTAGYAMTISYTDCVGYTVSYDNGDSVAWTAMRPWDKILDSYETGFKWQYWRAVRDCFICGLLRICCIVQQCRFGRLDSYETADSDYGLPVAVTNEKSQTIGYYRIPPSVASVQA